MAATLRGLQILAKVAKFVLHKSIACGNNLQTQAKTIEKMEQGQGMEMEDKNEQDTHGSVNNRLLDKTNYEKNIRNSMELELINEKYEMEKIIRKPSILPKTPTITSEEFNEYEDMFKDMPLTDETTCGIWCIKGPFLQKFANKKAYVLLYGLLGCFTSATYSYFTGTITSLEKRFKISSRTAGFISTGNDISQIFICGFLSYYAGKGHKPRWIAFGMYSMVLFCLLTALPHALFGPGETSLQLTLEYSGQLHDNMSETIIAKQNRKTLCQPDRLEECVEENGSFYPSVILLAAQIIGGIGGSVYHSLGVSYMDDNIQKSKTPVLISFAYFLRMLGPAIGYSLASFCLKLYVSPTLTPTISTNDPRWLGAWWLGWIVLSIILAVLSALMALFPKTLPRAAVRRAIAMEKNKNQKIPEPKEEKASFTDMMKTITRLMKNKTYVFNNLASIFYCLGYMPYWTFMPKYIETQYKQSASVSSFVTGTVGLIFSAIGVVVSGGLISRYKPRARLLAAWNVAVGAISVIGIISYIFLGCDAPPTTQINSFTGEVRTFTECNENCKCDYVSHAPVCSQHKEMFISACHAGCRDVHVVNKTHKVYTNCSCVAPSLNDSIYEFPSDFDEEDKMSGVTFSGNCPLDCTKPFYMFLAVVCLLKFVGATGRSSNFLVGVRCVEEQDKPAAMGFSLTILSLFAFVPSPVIFGHILDTTCLFWGKTCTGQGNCWLYDEDNLRYTMNIIAANLILIGTVFDAGVWFYVKNLKIFDEEVTIRALGVGSGGD